MIRIRPMTALDIPRGMQLKEQAGWNQTMSDWLRFLVLEPDGCFVAELNGEPAATAAACLFGSVAWIGMVLVDTGLRGRGIGAALVSHAVAFAEERGARTLRLDATPMGQPIYEKLGFVAEYTLARYAGILSPDRTAVDVRPVEMDQMEAIVRLDQTITATDRRKLLMRLFVECPDAMRMVRDDNGLRGFIAVRPGTEALQIGPCIASAEAGPALLAYVSTRYPGQNVFMDIPTANRSATAIAQARGLTAKRSFLRMCRGETVNDHIDGLWASSGPEMG